MLAARLASLALLLALLPEAPARASLAAESIPRYVIEVDLDYPSGTATVQQRVAYTNRTGARLTTLAFNVTPIHFGAFTLTSAAVDGQPVQATFEGVNMELPLQSPLEPGGSVEVVLVYRLKVPAQANLRFGRAGGILALGNFHPTVQVYTGDRWPRYRYTDVGDAFFTEAADYDVTLSVTGAAASLKVAHTGDLVDQSAGRWTFRARQVRDFALALSERYQIQQRVVGGTTVTAFYLPEHAAGGAQMLQTAAAALAWGNANLGTYPYATLQVAETTDPGGSGQEYPSAIFMGSGDLAGPVGPGSYLAYVVAHEVMHQWFYGLVGDDQVREPWLDEGPATQLGYLFIRSTAPAAYASTWETNVVQRYRSAVASWGDRPLDSTIYDFVSDGQYFALLYRKGALFLDELRQRMGDQAYFAMLRDFVTAHRYGIVTTAGFLRFAAARVPGDFPALVRRNFSPGAYELAFGSAAGPTPTPSPAATVQAPPSATPSATATATAKPSPTATATATPPAPSPTPLRPTPSATSEPAAASPTPKPPTPSSTVAPVSPTAAVAAEPTPPGPSATPVPGGVGDLTSPIFLTALALGVGLGGATAYAVSRRR